ncbi:hypothetical protein IWQ47_003795 [Aquimarina sp. EL_43]|uniref:hypothetical protein n=1 Tax=Aquimarina TaxID=290174 RepID=UPI000472DBC3|nr:MULTISPECIES: hypothetical protein [Aquimarina]MBG6132570.1 hypothetical protein [Aquimarina sp. EL_35]MBG6152701.1 hypothetical protein [Aquimarina sp. EL_32]MBG6170708.1 hypothetical protein [Aquimarina sp. EL_43]
MKKKSLNTKKLTLKKFEISKFNDLSKIHGGGGGSTPQNGVARCVSDSCGNGADCDSSIHLIIR